MNLGVEKVSPDELKMAWCNSDAATTCLLEAVSLCTPPLEKYLIQIVVSNLPSVADADLALRCRAFIEDEAAHSKAHTRLNAALLGPGSPQLKALRPVILVLDMARSRLARERQLMLVAALEHVTAVMSKRYLPSQASWCFDSPFAQALFSQHAREELAHCSVAFELWNQCNRRSGRTVRAFTISAILLLGLLYVAASIPSLMVRKPGVSRAGALGATLVLFRRGLKAKIICSLLPELFAFVVPGFQPDPFPNHT